MLAALAAIPSITLGSTFYIAFPCVITFYAKIRFQQLRWRFLNAEVMSESNNNEKVNSG